MSFRCVVSCADAAVLASDHTISAARCRMYAIRAAFSSPLHSTSAIAQRPGSQVLVSTSFIACANALRTAGFPADFITPGGGSRSRSAAGIAEGEPAFAFDLPATPDDLRKRFEAFLNERCKGKDASKLRFVVE